MDDPYDLERFVAAQDADATYERALGELRRGQKVGHWMWFVFPQVAGLGQSPTARRFAISSLEEASSYIAHGVLGPRLIEAATAVAGNDGRAVEQIFGGLDAKKLQSSMTLFLRAAPEEEIFGRVLEMCFGGRSDTATDELLRLAGAPGAAEAHVGEGGGGGAGEG